MVCHPDRRGISQRFSVENVRCAQGDHHHMIAAGLYQVMTSKGAIATPPGDQLDQTIPMCARPLSDVLHHYVVPWLQAEWPLNWQMLVGRAAPLVVEIGFGNGLFLIRQAERNPDVNLVGIELSWGWVQHLARRLDEAGLTACPLDPWRGAGGLAAPL